MSLERETNSTTAGPISDSVTENKNLVSFSFDILQKLGVQDLVYCAGARNSPFIKEIGRINGANSYSFFDERAAGFFALGLTKASGRPTAIFTTSGTAVAELLPAVIEAHYSGQPLVVVSSDRPKRYRGSGAPQSIEQSGIFGRYVDLNVDLDSESDLERAEDRLLNASRGGSVQLNICFEEPLVGNSIGDSEKILNWRVGEGISRPLDVNERIDLGKKNESKEFFAKPLDLRLQNFLVVASSPLVILSGEVGCGPVEDFLTDFEGPVYAESSVDVSFENFSGSLLPSENSVSFLLENKFCDSVVRIGGVPTLRAWRDLESIFSHIPVHSFSNVKYSGLSRDNNDSLKVERLEDLVFSTPTGEKKRLFSELTKKVGVKTREIFEKYPASEPGIFWSLKKQLNGGESIFVGNSLPIREFDLASSVYDSSGVLVGATECKSLKGEAVCRNQAYANRGANGIDGQISTFLGMAAMKPSLSKGVFGDLTSLYDLSSLWASSFIPFDKKIQIIVINNSGGQIFNRIFQNEDFLNRHDLSFSHWAKMWNFDHRLLNFENLSSSKFILESDSAREILEIKPCPEQTAQFWQEYDQFWAKMNS